MSVSEIKVIQMLPTLAYGDGVGNDALAIDTILKQMGYETKIYAENIDSRIEKGLAEKIENISGLCDVDVIIYHLSTGTKLNETLKEYPGRKIIIYHNITPAHFFADYNKGLEELCNWGRQGISEIREVADYCLADSEYNKGELVEAGYTCDIDVLPILIPYEDYEKEPNDIVMQQYADDWVNIVFVGRIAPNKKQEDIIKTFYYYKKFINPKSRLFLVGSYGGLERYYERLRNYADELQLEDVYFTGHTGFDEILAYYHIADVFLCMSEHEGFGIPLVEAMYFGIPIVAYSDTGAKEILADAGLRIEEKDCKAAAEMIDMLMQNEELRKNVIEIQKRRLKDFDYEVTRQKFIQYMEKFLSKKSSD